MQRASFQTMCLHFEKWLLIILLVFYSMLSLQPFDERVIGIKNTAGLFSSQIALITPGHSPLYRPAKEDRLSQP